MALTAKREKEREVKIESDKQKVSYNNTETGRTVKQTYRQRQTESFNVTSSELTRGVGQ